MSDQAKASSLEPVTLDYADGSGNRKRTSPWRILLGLLFAGFVLMLVGGGLFVIHVLNNLPVC